MGPKAAPNIRGRRWFAVECIVVLVFASLVRVAFLAIRAYSIAILAGFEEGDSVHVSPKAAALHAQLFVVDLHSDATFAQRDLLRRKDKDLCTTLHCERSHVDVPRLIKGNVGLQVLTSHTQVPIAPKCEGSLPICEPWLVGNKNSSFDVLGLMAAFNGFPLRALLSRTERALEQARRATSAEEHSAGSFRVIRNRTEFDRYSLDREACLGTDRGCDFTAAILGVEGAHALDGDWENWDRLHTAGFRLMSLHHFHDNAAGGSQNGESAGGLTEWGAEAVRELQRRGWVIDLAHSSRAVVWDVLRISKRPVVISHTGMNALCPNNRTIDDDTVRAVARGGGVVGIGYWSQVTCGTTVAAIADHLLHAVSVAGIEHVALGSDWDSVATPPGLDAAGVQQVTAELLSRGLSKEEISKIAGRNALRVIRESLL